MKTFKTALLSILAALGMTGGLYAADGLAQADENGIVPYVWWKFDGDAAACGSIEPQQDSFGATYVMSRNGLANNSLQGFGSGLGPGSDGKWTLTCCAKTSSTANGVIFSLGQRANGNYGLALARGDEGETVTLSSYNNNEQHEDLLTVAVDSPGSKYHFYALVVDGTTAILYLDGVAQTPVSITKTPSNDKYQFSGLHSGENNNGLKKVTGNAFDDVRYYRQALTSTQIANIQANFPVWDSSTATVEAGATLMLTEDTAYTKLVVGAGAVIDLNGHNLRIGEVSDTTFSADKLYVVTNSNDEIMSTVTLGILNGKLGFNKNAILGGNLRYVITGSNETHFRDSSNKDSFDVVPANTHTGGTVMSNNTGKVRFYGVPSLGSGTICFHGPSKLWIPSNYNLSDRYRYEQNIYVTGEENQFYLDSNAGDTAAFNFMGDFEGDGELKITSAYRHKIQFYGAMTNFTGTLNIALNPETKAPGDAFWLRGQTGITNGLEYATLKLSNVSADAVNAISLKPNEGGTQTFKIGHLVTEGAERDDYTNTTVRSCVQWATLTLQVGGANKSGTYAGNFVTEVADNGNGSHYTLEKVGTGTWTLSGKTFKFDREVTVKEGRLNFDTTYSATTVAVKNGATLGGNGIVSTAVTVEDGGAIAGSLTLSGGVIFSGAGTIEVAAGESITTTSDVNVANLTVRLTGALDQTQEYAILTAGNGSSGRATLVVDAPPAKGVWRTKWVTSGDTKILKGYYVKSGLVIIFK